MGPIWPVRRLIQYWGPVVPTPSFQIPGSAPDRGSSVRAGMDSGGGPGLSDVGDLGTHFGL